MEPKPTQIQISRDELAWAEPSPPPSLIARADTDPKTMRAVVTLSGHGPGVRAALPRVEQAIQALGPHVVVVKLSEDLVGTLHIGVAIRSDLPAADFRQDVRRYSRGCAA